MVTFTPSPEQSVFFASVLTTSSNIMLEASAGSGKTTTIEQLLKLPWMRTKKVLLLAFNKDIETELSRRCLPPVQTSTFHSFGLAAWRTKMFPNKVEVDPNKLKTLCKTLIPKYDFAYIAAACKLVEWAKSFGTGVFDQAQEADFRQLLLHFSEDLEVSDEPRLIFYAMQLLNQSNAQLDVVDFSDMLYFPLQHSLKWPRWDFVIIDEAQDTNKVQRELLRKICGWTAESAIVIPRTTPARLLAVGDPQQAIYGFRGADSGAIAALIRDFNMLTLPLAVSYRCSQAVVAEAQRISKQKQN